MTALVVAYATAYLAGASYGADRPRAALAYVAASSCCCAAWLWLTW